MGQTDDVLDDSKQGFIIHLQLNTAVPLVH